MFSSIYKNDVYDALAAARDLGYISKNTSFEEIKENINEILNFMFDNDEIDEFTEADWNLVDECINEWCN